ncbi:MAG TPA: DUF3098 domain-containing protein [Porphyromonadaceae bacterium]|nr:DUF3098 domain-containing protein [Porphyromonadaceae bacterium]
MSNTNFALGKTNFVLMAVSVVLIVIGFLLMSGGGSADETSFNPAIFDTRRIVIAPVTTLIGFVLMIFAIVFNRPTKITE